MNEFEKKIERKMRKHSQKFVEKEIQEIVTSALKRPRLERGSQEWHMQIDEMKQEQHKLYTHLVRFAPPHIQELVQSFNNHSYDLVLQDAYPDRTLEASEREQAL